MCRLLSVLVICSGIFLFLTGCRPDPIVIEVPYAIDSIALIPQWKTHPSFNGNAKQQWVSYADESRFVALGSSVMRRRDSNQGILNSGWDGTPFPSHSSLYYRPILNRDWMVVQYTAEGIVRITSTHNPVRQHFFSLEAEAKTQHLSFPLKHVWQPPSAIGAMVQAGIDSFHLALFVKDDSNRLGLLHLRGFINSGGHPETHFISLDLFPLAASADAYPAFIAQMGEQLLVGISGQVPGFFSEFLYSWTPGVGFRTYADQPHEPGTLHTAFPSADGSYSWLIAKGSLYQMKNEEEWILTYADLIPLNLTLGKDLGRYLAFYFGRRLLLFDKTNGQLWQTANLGLDGHNISDVSIFKDTMMISSYTGGIFYQAMSTVWPR